MKHTQQEWDEALVQTADKYKPPIRDKIIIWFMVSLCPLCEIVDDLCSKCIYTKLYGDFGTTCLTIGPQRRDYSTRRRFARARRRWVLGEVRDRLKALPDDDPFFKQEE